MKRTLLSATALATLLTVPAVGLTTAHAAPTPPSEPTLLRAMKVKVDGDKSLDTVKLFQLSQTSFRLQVTTAKTTASVDFTSQVNDLGNDVNDVWYGAAELDGTKGAEIIVRRFLSEDDDDGTVPMGVFTWRGGKLVAEGSPAAAHTTTWRIDGDGSVWRGYHFFTRAHHRYVDALVTPQNSTRTTAIRSVWSHGKWKKQSKRTIKLTEAKTDALAEFTGPKILRNQFRSDLDGDGAQDRFTYYSTDATHYVTKIVTAKGKKLSKTIISADGSPLLGAAHFDGVPGTELAYIVDGELPAWEVYTWRNGKLVAALPPSLVGEKPGKYWSDGNTDDSDSLVFSVVNGIATAVAISHDGDVPECYLTATSQWQSDKWVLVGHEQCAASVTPEFTDGIVADFVN